MESMMLSQFFFTDKPRQFFWFLPEVLALVAFRVKLKGWRELLAVSSLRLYVNIHLCWESIVQKFILIYRMNMLFFCFMPFWSFSFPVWKYYNFHKLSLFLTTKKSGKIQAAPDSKSKALADWFFRWTVLHQYGSCLGWWLGDRWVSLDGQGNTKKMGKDGWMDPTEKGPVFKQKKMD